METDYIARLIRGMIPMCLVTVLACSTPIQRMGPDSGSPGTAHDVGTTEMVSPDGIDWRNTIVEPDDTVDFRQGKTHGPMSGLGWVTVGEGGQVTSPTCETGIPITHGTPCTTTLTWNDPSALCVSATIQALPPNPAPFNFVDNWGLYLGVNAKEPLDAIGKQISTVNVKTRGAVGYRVVVHKKGDPDDTLYCQTYVGSPIRITEFNTKCWGDPTTEYFHASDSHLIDKIMIHFPSSSAPITLDNFCLISITLR